MSEKFVERNLGIRTADAEQVELVFTGNNLRVRYVDVMDRPGELVLPETVAFRWQEYDFDGSPRDDVTYEVMDSSWLASQQPPREFMTKAQLRHYKLCFNACGSLDVICRAIEGAVTDTKIPPQATAEI